MLLELSWLGQRVIMTNLLSSIWSSDTTSFRTAVKSQPVSGSTLTSVSPTNLVCRFKFLSPSRESIVYSPAIIGTDWSFASCNSPSGMHSYTAGLGFTVSDIHTAETFCLSGDWSQLLTLFCLQPCLMTLLES